ncbi:MAG: YbaK/EbsC family protein [Candidatus Magasanikiibacteriota bacterium]
MIDQNQIYEKIIKILDDSQVEYKLFSHQEALTYEDLAKVQKETGFIGAEMKCLVLKANDTFFVYITLQGEKVNFDIIKEKLGVSKVKLCSAEELNEYFGAKPGCAYPFGFATQYNIYVDPRIYNQEWLLFSPILSTKTVQAKGSDLKIVFDNLDNKVEEVINFNLTN